MNPWPSARPAAALVLLLLSVLPNLPAQTEAAAQETVADSQTAPDESLLAALQHSAQPVTRAALIREFFQRFPQSKWIDSVCEIEFRDAIAADTTASVTRAAEVALSRPCMQTRACTEVLAVLDKADASDSALLWVDRCHKVASEILNAQEAPHTKEQLAEARALAKQAEYRVFLLAWNARTRSDAQGYLARLRALNKDSEYIASLHDQTLHGAVASGDPNAVARTASAILATDADHPGALIALAEAHLQRNQALDQVIPLTSRALAVLDKPRGAESTWQQEGIDAAAIVAQRGRALWLQGIYFSNKRRWQEANTTLRKCLSAIQHDPAQTAAALYHLGLANSQLDRTSESTRPLQDAIRYLEQCERIASPYRTHALALLATLRTAARQ